MVEARRLRRPQGTLLYRVVQDHLEEFLRLVCAFGMSAWFIEKAFREYLDCGIPERGGSALIKCKACGHREEVARSCKRRGVCPSCDSRRMLADAAELVDGILPVATYRHVVVSFPFEVNKKLAFRPAVLAKVERAVMKVLLQWQAERGLRDGDGGGVLFRHRFREDMAMGIHDHILLLDEWFTYVPAETDARTGEVLVWRAVEMQQEDIDRLAARLWKRIKKVLKRAGIEIGAKKSAGHAEAREEAGEQLALFAAARGHKERSGAALGQTAQDEVEEPTAGMWARVEGLHLFVSPTIDGADRKNLERLCQYLLRPAFSPGRLRQRADGKLTYRLKRKDKDGNTVLVMTPLEFLRRLMDLIPAPRQRTRKLFGILAPRAKKRDKVIPNRIAEKCAHGAEQEATSVTPGKWRSNWAELMQRAWGVDVLKCPRCQGRMRIVKAEIREGGKRIDQDATALPRVRGPPERTAAPPQAVA